MSVRGVGRKWNESYLTNRKHIVSIDNYSSNTCKIEYGVPQGSVLGPKFFLIYINDIFQVVSSGELVVYADDTNLL